MSVSIFRLFYRRFLQTFALAGLLVTAGCMGRSGHHQKLMTPDKQDAQLIVQYDQLAQELDHGLSREIFNHLRSEPQRASWRLSMIQGTPLPVDQLVMARTYFKQQVEIAVRARAWPSPVAIHVPRTQAALKIDGVIDEADWHRTSSVPLNFKVNEGHAQAAIAHVRLLWDESFLYMAFNVQDADIQTLPRQRDGQVYRDDCVEFFIMSDPVVGLFWEVNVSPTGGIYDALCLWRPDAWASEIRRDLDIKGMQVGIRQITTGDVSAAAGYVVEIAMPWNQLQSNMGKQPAAGDVMHGLFAISNVNSSKATTTRTFLSHTPMLANFHNIKTYSSVTLGE